MARVSARCAREERLGAQRRRTRTWLLEPIACAFQPPKLPLGSLWYSWKPWCLSHPAYRMDTPNGRRPAHA